VQRLAIAGSAPDHAGYRRTGEADPETPMQATIVLRPLDSGVAEALLSGIYNPSSDGAHGTDEAALAAVQAFAHKNGLTVKEADPAGRRIVVTGPLSRMSHAFNVRFSRFVSPDGQAYFSYDGLITVPEDIAPFILAVLGLDTRPVAREKGT
jgi:kumamolisin